MPDETGNTTQDPTPAGASNTSGGNMVPQSRFNEVNRERNELRDQIAKLQQAQAENEAKRLADEQKWQELAEQRAKQIEALQPAAEQVASMREALQETVQAQIEQLPEAYREMVPVDYDDPRKTLAWLNKNAAKLVRPTAPPLDGGAGRAPSPGGSRLTPEDEKMAALAGIPLDRYAQMKEQREKNQQLSEGKEWLSGASDRLRHTLGE